MLKLLSLFEFTMYRDASPCTVLVLDPGKGVCADPVERVAILEVKGPGPPGGVSERQLSPDWGGKKT